VVPAAEGLLYAQMKLALSAEGALRKTLFRLPPIMLEVEYASGRHDAYRLAPKVAQNGLLLSQLPPNLAKLAGLFRCQAADQVRRFKITGRGADFLKPSLKLTWQQSLPPCTIVTKYSVN
jgi:hypothetical protein